MLRCHCMPREKPFHFCVLGLWQDGALSLRGRDIDPPRAGAGLATGVRVPPPGLRDGAACGEQGKEREGCFGWGWWLRSPTATPEGGGPENPLLLSDSSHPQFPSLSPAGTRRHVVAVVQPGSLPGTQSRMESGSRGEVEASSPGFIPCGRHNTSHELGGLKQEKLTLSHSGGRTSTLPPCKVSRGEPTCSLFPLLVLLAPWLVAASLVPVCLLSAFSPLHLLLCVLRMRMLVIGFPASHIIQGDLFIFRSLT